jgi:hypothetical protein
MKDLRLPLKTNWFEMTKAGIKTEDYRELNEYWFNRLVDSIYDEKGRYNKKTSFFLYDRLDYFRFVFKYFDRNVMTLGYPKSTDTERILKLEHKEIEIRTGNPEWGAEPNKLYFVIKHGNIIP